MALPAEVRFDVGTAELLDQLAQEPNPLGLRTGPLTRSAFRDVYFDTADGELRRRHVICTLRIRMDDRRFLTLRVRGPGGASVEVFEAKVNGVAPEDILKGDSPPARRLQALVDPGRLAALVELSVDRRVRHARRGFLPLPQLELAYDDVTVRARTDTARFQEAVIRPLRRGGVDLDQLARQFEDRYGLRQVLVDRSEWAEKRLETLEAERLAQDMQRNRAVTVLALQGGRIALTRGEDGLHLPLSPGHGEEACRVAMRAVFGSAEGQVLRLGVVGATATRPAIEVWLARRLRRQLSEDPRLQWFAPSEVINRVGSPVLRNPETLGALTVAARSQLLPEWSAAALEDGSSPQTEVDPEVVAASRRTLAELRIPVLPEESLDTNKATPDQFLNAELSWLEFNERVLALAEDPGIPLLDRVRFLAIFSTNLDEFFAVKVGGLKRAAAAGVTKPSPDGLSPQEQLDVISIRVRALVERQYRCFRGLAARDLPARGVRLRRWQELSDTEQQHLRAYFDDQVFSVLTPKALTGAPGHPFPLIEDLHLSLALMTRAEVGGPVHFAHVGVPDALPRFVRLPDGNDFVLIEEVIRANIGVLFPGRRVQEVHPFRVTRLGDLDLDEQVAADFLQAIEDELRRRPQAPVVRIEVDRKMPKPIRELLLRELRFEEAEHSGLTDSDVYEVDGMVDLGGLQQVADLDLAELHYPPLQQADPFPAGQPVLDTIDRRDVLVHHPYDSFEASFERFIGEAADDPEVLSIKLTLYRPGGPSAIGDALTRAAAAGKGVSVFVELKARFDEQRNIVWARQLARAGIHVVTGLVNYKTHAKVALIVRRKDGRLRCYAHVGTGNYNRQSARQYTDVGLFTANEGLTDDLNALFNELTGSPEPPRAAFQQLLVAPTNMLRRFLELIEREAAHARAGRPARIRAKLNALGDDEIIGALYRASQAGVNVDLMVRGFCTLRPGVPGLSERIRVFSILGRFLEHARIYAFENGGDPEFYIGSADWRPRNVRRRVEVAAPVTDPAARERLNRILNAELDDPLAWVLNSDGSYERFPPPVGVELLSAQEQFLEGAAARVAGTS